MATNPDQETLTLLRRRDSRGFDQAYAKYGARLFTFLCRLLGRAQQHAAEDLLQHTFLKLAEHGAELRPDSDLRAWLYTVARHAFLGRLRQQRAEAPPGALELVPDYSPDAEARLLLGDVEAALERLRHEDRELLLLVGAEGLEPGVVAQMLDLPAATVRKRLERARQRLLQALGQSAARASKEVAS